MAEYIERDKVLSYAYCPTQLTVDNPLAEDKSVVDVEDIESIPTADVAEVKHGEWIETQEMFYDGDFQSEYPMTCYKCSECGLINTSKYPYCNCGAKMDE